jgi:hypothetical protein
LIIAPTIGAVFDLDADPVLHAQKPVRAIGNGEGSPIHSAAHPIHRRGRLQEHPPERGSLVAR